MFKCKTQFVEFIKTILITKESKQKKPFFQYFIVALFFSFTDIKNTR